MKTITQCTGIILVILISMACVSAKDVEVRGKITTFDEYPLNRVSVTVKGSQNSVLSESDGSFKIVCDEADKLVFRAKGFSGKTIALGRTGINAPLQVNLKLKDGEKNYELATVFGHISEETLSRDILLLNPGSDYATYGNISDILADQPNLDGGRMGFKPMYIVDGFEVDYDYLKNLPTTDIESIAVLRNTAAARYGTKGYRGVIEVVTKSK